MKNGVILVNGYTDIAAIKHQVDRLKQEFSALSVNVTVIKSNEFHAYFDGDKIVGDVKGDFCVYLDKDPYISFLLERTGVRLFNSHKAVFLCDDKMKTHAYLGGNGIKMPATLPAPLCYTDGAKIPESEISRIEKILGYPVIVKTCYGSRGEGVFKADDRGELVQLMQKLAHTPHLYQKFIAECAGRDIRAIVVGGKLVACMERKSDCDFRSNIELGGKGGIYAADNALKALCERVATLMGLDYCGIDILPAESGYTVCEVNSNAFFRGIEQVTGINVARAYCEHIIRSV